MTDVTLHGAAKSLYEKILKWSRDPDNDEAERALSYLVYHAYCRELHDDMTYSWGSLSKTEAKAALILNMFVQIDSIIVSRRMNGAQIRYFTHAGFRFGTWNDALDDKGPRMRESAQQHASTLYLKVATILWGPYVATDVLNCLATKYRNRRKPIRSKRVLRKTTGSGHPTPCGDFRCD